MQQFLVMEKFVLNLYIKKLSQTRFNLVISKSIRFDVKGEKKISIDCSDKDYMDRECI